MEYLGFWVTRNGIRLINKKVEAIVNMMPPMRLKLVRAFVGLVNYYRDMWARMTHLIHPLTALTPNKVKFKWTDVEQKAFDDIKRAIAHETLSAYLYFNTCFDVYTDARDYQLGSVIGQGGKTISFCSQ